MDSRIVQHLRQQEAGLSGLSWGWSDVWSDPIDWAQRARDEAARVAQQAADEAARVAQQAADEAQRIRDQAAAEAQRARDKIAQEAATIRDQAQHFAAHTLVPAIEIGTGVAFVMDGAGQDVLRQAWSDSRPYVVMGAQVAAVTAAGVLLPGAGAVLVAVALQAAQQLATGQGVRFTPEQCLSLAASCVPAAGPYLSIAANAATAARDGQISPEEFLSLASSAGGVLPIPPSALDAVEQARQLQAQAADLADQYQTARDTFEALKSGGVQDAALGMLGDQWPQTKAALDAAKRIAQGGGTGEDALRAAGLVGVDVSALPDEVVAGINDPQSAIRTQIAAQIDLSKITALSDYAQAMRAHLPTVLNEEAAMANVDAISQVADLHQQIDALRQEFATAQVADAGDFVDACYRILLGREADADGRSNWVTAINGGMKRADVLASFAGSDEFKQHLKVLAGAEAAPAIAQAEARAQIAEAARQAAEAHALDLQTALDSLRQEFASAQVADVGDFVDACYRILLGRDADADGRNNWVSAINGGAKRADVLAAFAASAEFQQHLQALAGAQAAPAIAQAEARAQLAEVARQAAEAHALDLQAAMDHLREQFATAQVADVGDFVDACYRILLGRDADADGRVNWISAINAGTKRADVLATFAGSAEFQQHLQSIAGTQAAPAIAQAEARAQTAEAARQAAEQAAAEAAGTVADLRRQVATQAAALAKATGTKVLPPSRQAWLDQFIKKPKVA